MFYFVHLIWPDTRGPFASLSGTLYFFYSAQPDTLGLSFFGILQPVYCTWHDTQGLACTSPLDAHCFFYLSWLDSQGALIYLKDSVLDITP